VGVRLNVDFVHCVRTSGVRTFVLFGGWLRVPIGRCCRRLQYARQQYGLLTRNTQSRDVVEGGEEGAVLGQIRRGTGCSQAARPLSRIWRYWTRRGKFALCSTL